MMVLGKRVIGDIDDGRFIDFEDWGWGEHIGTGMEAVALVVGKDISDGIDATLSWSPPAMSFQYDGRIQDVILQVGLGLAKGEWGPSWDFSLRESIESAREEYGIEDRKKIASFLRQAADFFDTDDE